ncbi:MAG: O-antigen/teichoic acid export membrane protein [Bermanella sp.]|jgi:O-antigen/teichoic acid export membrane protein
MIVLCKKNDRVIFFPMISELINKIKIQNHMNYALVDQVIVSGVNFSTGLFLAKVLGVEAFGIFSLLWMTPLLINSVQMALITSPMMSLGAKKTGAHAEVFNTQMVSLQLFFAIFTFVIIYSGILVFQVMRPDLEVEQYKLSLAFAGAFFQTQDFVRRYLFCTGEFKRAVANDVVSYGGQLIGLAVLAYSGMLTINSTLSIISFTSLVAIIIAIGHIEFRFANLLGLKVSVLEIWQFSKWLLASAIVRWFSGNLSFIISGVILGAASVGLMNAAQNLVAISHILFQALENFMPSLASKKLIEEGRVGLSLYVNHALVLGGLITLFLVLVISYFSSELMTFVYDDEYAKHSYIIYWFAPTYVLMYLSLVLQAGLRSLEVPKQIFKSRLFAAIIMVVIVWPAIQIYGINGAMFAITLSMLTFTVSLHILFKLQLEKLE